VAGCQRGKSHLAGRPCKYKLYYSICNTNRGTMGVNSLPKTVSRQRRDCDLNPGPSAPESSTLTTRPSYARLSCGWMPPKWPTKMYAVSIGTYNLNSVPCRPVSVMYGVMLPCRGFEFYHAVSYRYCIVTVDPNEPFLVYIHCESKNKTL